MSRTRWQRGACALIAALAVSSAAACSSAPVPPSALAADGSSTTNGGTAAAGGATAPAAGGTTAGSTGAPVSGPGISQPDGSTAGGGTAGGAATGGGSVGAGSAGASTAGTGGTTAAGGSTTGTGGTTAVHSTLFTPAENRIGITKDSITLCVHAALTYAQAFGTKDTDFNVFWQALNTEKGGINGRTINVTYENDNYTPTDAVTAATKCKAKNPFMLLGGIGFDQIPAVRNYVEQNHMFYLHHTATINGTKGQKYSFTELPTVERVGESFAQLAGSKYRGAKIGIIERDSANWSPGVEAFKKVAGRYGIKVVADNKVAQNKGNYTQDILDMKSAGADVVWIWLNALESTQLLKQAKAQGFNPHWLLFPFNLTSQTLDSDAMNPPLDGVAMFPAYSNKDYSGSFSSYASDMKEFEAQYAKYDPNADLSGIGGDLLFLNWVGQKALAVQLAQCGKDCTRNRMVDVLQSYTGQAPTKTSCPLDFRADGHRGSVDVNFMTTYRSPSGKVNWRNTTACVGP
jgi:ABC-type branched-subunit amino acid transport system substrate-binding protein